MKAWMMDDYNGVDGLRLDESIDKPKAEDGRVVVKLHYAALNPADRYLSEKMYPARPTFPHILGRDGVGTVEESGEGAGKFKPGDTVALLRGRAGVSEWGTFAEYASVPQRMLVAVPRGWEEQHAAAAPLVYQTAHMALNQWGELPEESNILITGASGGVGVACIQLGKAMGHRLIALSRSEEKGKKLQELGADAVFNPNDPELVKKVKDFTGKPGVALAVDNIGGDLFNKVIDTLGHWGCISCVGRLAGPVPELNTGKLFFKRLRIGGVAVATYSTEEAQEAWSDVIYLLGQLGQRPLIDSVYSFEELKEAFARLKEGPLGKVLIKVE